MKVLINRKGKEITNCDEFFDCRDGLIGINRNGKWGIISQNGDTIIPCQYEKISGFHEGLCKVKINGKIGFINDRNKLVINAIYDDGSYFKDGCCKVSLNKKWGLINAKGEILVPLTITDKKEVPTCNNGLIRIEIERVCEYSNGSKIIVNSNGKYGFIDEKENVNIPYQYEYIGCFSEGLSKVRINGKIGYINKNNQIIIQPIYDEGSYFKDGCCKVVLNGKVGVINSNGQLLVPHIYNRTDRNIPQIKDLSNKYPQYGCVDISDYYSYYQFINTEGDVIISRFKARSVRDFSDNLSAVCNCNDKYGYIDKKGNVAIPFIYEYATNFIDGISVVRTNDYCGIINKHGEIITPFIYTAIRDFEKGYAWVRKDDKYGLIDKTGKEIVPCIYEDTNLGYHSIHENIVYGKSKDVYTFYNISGNKLFSIKAEDVGTFKEGLCRIMINHKWGFVDSNGKIIIPCIYDDVCDFTDGLCLVSKNKKEYIINHKGLELFSIPGKISHRHYKTTPNFPIIITDIRCDDEYCHYGLLNSSGNIIFTAATISIAYVYYNKPIFSARKYDSQKGTTRAGFVNENGRVIIPFKYIEAEDFEGEYTIVTTDSSNSTPKSKPVTSNEGCYIATCVYGSYDCPEVMILREYRDKTLSKSSFGKFFIKIYYSISPTLVKHFGNHRLFKKIWKTIIERIINRLKHFYQ